jgi:hypothetical protein
MPERDLLDEQVIHQNGSWLRVRRWWRGIHAEKGTITRGWTGWETVEEKDRLLASHTFFVNEMVADQAHVPTERDQFTPKAA